MARSVYFDPSLIGNDQGLHVSDEGFKWCLRRPRDSMLFSGKQESIGLSAATLDDAFLLESAQVPAQPPAKYAKSIIGLPDKAAPMWSMVMPPSEWKSWVKSMVTKVFAQIDATDFSYYDSAWTSHLQLFESIERMAAPEPRFFAVEAPEVASFKPRGDRCDKIVYNRFGTRTGRLTVAAGPSIQTLRKDARKFLRSRWDENGILASLDFSAVEARVLASEISGVVPSLDPYEDLATYLGNSFTRDAAKLALISVIYGSGERTLAASLNTTPEQARRVHDAVFHKYGLHKLLDKLRASSSSGFLRNKYGRRVNLPETADRILLNSYVQSTAADVALYGFLEIVKRLDSDVAVPVALLHDALIVDCKRSVVDRLGGLIHVPVPGYEGKFPIKITQFNA